jgi:hypothetical protein
MTWSLTRAHFHIHQCDRQSEDTHHQYTGTQLADVGTNGVSWSAFTWLSDNTLFVTEARTSLNQQTAPWLAQSSSAQWHRLGHGDHSARCAG